MDGGGDGRAGHIVFLDSLRGLAAVFVVMHHAFLLSPRSRAEPASGAGFTWLTWLNWGHLAVDLFIVLSGFVLLLPVVRARGVLAGGGWGFMRRRARRILPPYYASLALAYLLLAVGLGGWNGDTYLPVTPTGVLAHLLMIHNWLDLKAPNVALWSVALEFQIYLIVPLLVLGARRVALPLVFVAAGLVAHELPRVCFMPLGYWFVGLFCMGGMAAWVVADPGAFATRLRRAPWGLAAAALLAALGGWLYHFGLFRDLIKADYLTGLAVMSLIVALVLSPDGIVARALRWHPLVSLGAFSYSLYLVHMPLLTVFDLATQRLWHLGDHARGILLMLGGVPFCVAVAFLFYLVAERPFLSRRPATVPARPQPC